MLPGRRCLALALAVLIAAAPFSTVEASSTGTRRSTPASNRIRQPERKGRISGTAKNDKNVPLPFHRVRLRITDTGQVVQETKSDRKGAFVFLNLNPGTYVIEIVDATGAILGTTTVSLSTTMVVTGVTVTASATAAAAAGATIGAAAAGGGGFFTSTGGVILLASAGLGFSALIVTKVVASPSR